MKRLILFATLLLTSCLSDLTTSPELYTDPGLLDPAAVPLNDSVESAMNGVYAVLAGREFLGEEIVGRWIGGRWCLHANHDVVFAEFAGGSLKDSIILAGYFRIVRSGAGSRLNLSISSAEGAGVLLSDSIPPTVVLRGITADGNSIVLQRVRATYNPPTKFSVMAHRGGGRNSERLGISENSVSMLRHAQVFGATGVEIDVKRTRDGRFIIFHDDTFSPRTVQGTYLLGNVENFDLRQIQQYGRLIHGEPIPTLTEALDAVIDSTILSYVWLDIKSLGNFDDVIRIQRDAMIRAAGKGRDLRILLGIPSREVLTIYDASSLANSTPVLIELDVDAVLAHSTCEVWAPRWTNGILGGDIDRVHNAGKRIFTWTLDVRDYIADFLYRSKIDGILSNYPSLVAGMEYSRE